MIITIDRFEGEFAVCELEDRTFANLPRAFLPQAAKEGSKLSIELDEAATADAAERIQGKMDQLFGD